MKSKQQSNVAYTQDAIENDYWSVLVKIANRRPYGSAYVEPSFLKSRQQLIEAGVNNLKEFGFPDANKDNILSDAVYARFFGRMLLDSKEKHPEAAADIDAVAAQLCEEARADYNKN